MFKLPKRIITFGTLVTFVTRVMDNSSIKKKWVINVLLGLATFLFPIAILAPIFTLSKFIFFETEFSIVTGLIDLLQDGRFQCGYNMQQPIVYQA